MRGKEQSERAGCVLEFPRNSARREPDRGKVLSPETHEEQVEKFLGPKTTWVSMDAFRFRVQTVQWKLRHVLERVQFVVSSGNVGDCRDWVAFPDIDCASQVRLGVPSWMHFLRCSAFNFATVAEYLTVVPRVESSLA